MKRKLPADYGTSPDTLENPLSGLDLWLKSSAPCVGLGTATSALVLASGCTRCAVYVMTLDTGLEPSDFACDLQDNFHECIEGPQESPKFP